MASVISEYKTILKKILKRDTILPKHEVSFYSTLAIASKDLLNTSEEYGKFLLRWIGFVYTSWETESPLGSINPMLLTFATNSLTDYIDGFIRGYSNFYDVLCKVYCFDITYRKKIDEDRGAVVDKNLTVAYLKLWTALIKHDIYGNICLFADIGTNNYIVRTFFSNQFENIGPVCLPYLRESLSRSRTFFNQYCNVFDKLEELCTFASECFEIHKKHFEVIYYLSRVGKPYHMKYIQRMIAKDRVSCVLRFHLIFMEYNPNFNKDTFFAKLLRIMETGDNYLRYCSPNIDVEEDLTLNLAIQCVSRITSFKDESQIITWKFLPLMLYTKVPRVKDLEMLHIPMDNNMIGMIRKFRSYGERDLKKFALLSLNTMPKVVSKIHVESCLTVMDILTDVLENIQCEERNNTLLIPVMECLSSTLWCFGKKFDNISPSLVNNCVVRMIRQLVSVAHGADIQTILKAWKCLASFVNQRNLMYYVLRHMQESAVLLQNLASETLHHVDWEIRDAALEFFKAAAHTDVEVWGEEGLHFINAEIGNKIFNRLNDTECYVRMTCLQVVVKILTSPHHTTLHCNMDNLLRKLVQNFQEEDPVVKKEILISFKDIRDFQKMKNLITPEREKLMLSLMKSAAIQDFDDEVKTIAVRFLHSYMVEKCSSISSCNNHDIGKLFDDLIGNGCLDTLFACASDDGYCLEATRAAFDAVKELFHLYREWMKDDKDAMDILYENIEISTMNLAASFSILSRMEREFSAKEEWCGKLVTCTRQLLAYLVEETTEELEANPMDCYW